LAVSRVALSPLRFPLPLSRFGFFLPRFSFVFAFALIGPFHFPQSAPFFVLPMLSEFRVSFPFVLLILK